MATSSTSATSATSARRTDRAESAEWTRLTAALTAYQRRTEPGAHHCFCGSLEQLRAAVAALPRAGASRARVVTYGHRGRHHDQTSRHRQDAARHAQRGDRQHAGRGR